MDTILEYIMENYTWILGGAIIILLAIIGSYADKTNFGQGKNEESDNKNTDLDKIDESKVLDRPINEALNIQNKETKSLENHKQEGLTEENKGNVLNLQEDSTQVIDSQTNLKENLVNSEIKVESSFEDSFEKFDKEFNEILPEREVINNELLDEIESLSLDKTQKIDLTDLPNLDDVELPKIKSLDLEEDDVWKF